VTRQCRPDARVRPWYHLAPHAPALRSWLARARVDPGQTMKVLIAAGEAVATAIEHGHAVVRRAQLAWARPRPLRPWQ
jgi:anti-sigma regulatory factor (Ser/Thr protein kinase)